MEPPAAYRPPPLNQDTERLFRAVHGALNDIDRALYPPFETLRERHGELIDAYEAVADRFVEQARCCGLADWLRFRVVQRTFRLRFDERLDEARSLYEEMERLGYPDVNCLISMRMIWANRLRYAGEIAEASAVVRRLVADLRAFREMQPGTLDEGFDDELAAFCRRHGVS